MGGVTTSLRRHIEFNNHPSTEPKKIRLFICCVCPPPASFWENVQLLTNLEKIHELLKTPSITLKILTYGLTIVQSSSQLLNEIQATTT